ncbi:MAG TPA: GtrA family protein [Solirubrobacteraceae bacterium]|nr:GtrA family protein [Solirubrobacteraceae bacterium]
MPAGAGAFAVGGVNGFVLNRSWTFGSRGSVLRAGSRYAVVQAVGLLANLALLRLAVAGLGVSHLLAQALAVGPVTLLCFALSRLWVFRADRHHDGLETLPSARPGGARVRRALRRRRRGRPRLALRGRVAADGRR